MTLGSAPSAFKSAIFPSPLDATVRLAAQDTGSTPNKKYTIGPNGGGNGLWLYSSARLRWEYCYLNGAGMLIDTQSCTINGVANQAMAANTRYFVYAKAPAVAGDFLTLDHSTTSFAGGDPNGELICTGYQFKTGNSWDSRLIGGVKPDWEGYTYRAGTRGVTTTQIGSYYQRQRVDFQAPVSASAQSNTSWAAVPGGAYFQTWWWGDGSEGDCSLNGWVSCSTANTKVFVGVSINLENPPYDGFPMFCAVANQPYQFSVDVSTQYMTSNDVVNFMPMAYTEAGNWSMSAKFNGNFTI